MIELEVSVEMKSADWSVGFGPGKKRDFGQLPCNVLDALLCFVSENRIFPLKVGLTRIEEIAMEDYWQQRFVCRTWRAAVDRWSNFVLFAEFSRFATPDGASPLVFGLSRQPREVKAARQLTSRDSAKKNQDGRFQMAPVLTPKPRRLNVREAFSVCQTASPSFRLLPYVKEVNLNLNFSLGARFCQVETFTFPQIMHIVTSSLNSRNLEQPPLPLNLELRVSEDTISAFSRILGPGSGMLGPEASNEDRYFGQNYPGLFLQSLRLDFPELGTECVTPAYEETLNRLLRYFICTPTASHVTSCDVAMTTEEEQEEGYAKVNVKRLRFLDVNLGLLNVALAHPSLADGRCDLIIENVAKLTVHATSCSPQAGGVQSLANIVTRLPYLQKLKVAEVYCGVDFCALGQLEYLSHLKICATNNFALDEALLGIFTSDSNFNAKSTTLARLELDFAGLPPPADDASGAKLANVFNLAAKPLSLCIAGLNQSLCAGLIERAAGGQLSRLRELELTLFEHNFVGDLKRLMLTLRRNAPVLSDLQLSYSAGLDGENAPPNFIKMPGDLGFLGLLPSALTWLRLENIMELPNVEADVGVIKEWIVAIIRHVIGTRIAVFSLRTWFTGARNAPSPPSIGEWQQPDDLVAALGQWNFGEGFDGNGASYFFWFPAAPPELRDRTVCIRLIYG